MRYPVISSEAKSHLNRWRFINLWLMLSLSLGLHSLRSVEMTDRHYIFNFFQFANLM